MDKNGKCSILGDDTSYTGPMRCGACPGQHGMKDAGGADWAEDLANLSDMKDGSKELYMFAQELLMVFMGNVPLYSLFEKNFKSVTRSDTQKKHKQIAIKYLTKILEKTIDNNKLTEITDVTEEDSEGRGGKQSNCTMDNKDTHECLLNTSIIDKDDKTNSMKGIHLRHIKTWIKNNSGQWDGTAKYHDTDTAEKEADENNEKKDTFFKWIQVKANRDKLESDFITLLDIPEPE